MHKKPTGSYVCACQRYTDLRSVCAGTDTQRRSVCVLHQSQASTGAHLQKYNVGVTLLEPWGTRFGSLSEGHRAQVSGSLL